MFLKWPSARLLENRVTYVCLYIDSVTIRLCGIMYDYRKHATHLSKFNLGSQFDL